MKKLIKFTAILLLFLAGTTGCFEYPVDDDGLLINNDPACYVLDFDLIDTDQKTIRASVPIIDTISCTIDFFFVYGAVLDNVYPTFSLKDNCKLSPKITGRMNLSDLQPRQWTVISGNRKVHKVYTVYFHEEQPLEKR